MPNGEGAESRRRHWVERQLDGLKELCRHTVAAWHGVELAVREVGPDGAPQWYDERIPALQLDRLDLLSLGGPMISIVTYQNGDRFGLCRLDDLPPLDLGPSAPESIFRARSLTEMPVGGIDAVDVVVGEHGDIAEVRLRVGEHDVLLRAAEVWEELDGSLRIVEMDESILVQVDGRMPARRPRSGQTTPPRAPV